MGAQAETAVIVEMDAERDRKTCIALDLKIAGGNRELGQWLIDHPRYTHQTIADWLGCTKSRISYLRKWAREGFVGTPFGLKNTKRDVQHVEHSALKSLEISENDEQDPEEAEVADPATIEDNVLYTLSRMNEHAKMFKRIFRLSSFDRETKERISTAIDRMILKWRSTQATLTKRSDRDV